MATALCAPCSPAHSPTSSQQFNSPRQRKRSQLGGQSKLQEGGLSGLCRLDLSNNSEQPETVVPEGNTAPLSQPSYTSTYETINNGYRQEALQRGGASVRGQTAQETSRLMSRRARVPPSQQPSTCLAPATPVVADMPPAGSNGEPHKLEHNNATRNHVDPQKIVLTSCFSYMPLSTVAKCGLTCKRWYLMTLAFWQESLEAELVLNAPSDLTRVTGALRAAVNLRRLTLVFGCPFDDRMLCAVAAACSAPLDVVDIVSESPGNNRVVGEGLRALVHRCSSTLTRLSVNDCGSLKRFAIAAPRLVTLEIEGCTALERLELCACDVLSDLSLDMMPTRCPWALPYSLVGNLHPSTVYAQMEKYGFSMAGVKVLVGLMGQLAAAKLPLAALHVSSPLMTDAAVTALLADTSHELTCLSITHCPFLTDRSVDTITQRCNELYAVDLSGCNAVGSDAVHKLCQTFCHTLSELHIAACPRITAQSAAAAVQSAYNLQTLDIGHSLLDASGGNPTTLFKLSHSNLRVLSLWGCLAVQRMKLNCPKLRELNIRDCRRLSASRSALDVRVDELQLLHTGGCSESIHDATTFGSTAKRMRYST